MLSSPALRDTFLAEAQAAIELRSAKPTERNPAEINLFLESLTVNPWSGRRRSRSRGLKKNKDRAGPGHRVDRRPCSLAPMESGRAEHPGSVLLAPVSPFRATASSSWFLS